jgi:hypothetical protein
LCDGIGDADPTQVFEVRGINLELGPARLRPEYYLRWMMDPVRVDPSSRMPRLADDEGQTAFTEFLDGDARAQFGAIWAFLRSVR